MSASESTTELLDRGNLLTEQRNARSMKLDALSVRKCVRLINSEDQTVALAVAKAEKSISTLIEAVELRMFRAAEAGAMGRLIYIGAGTSGRLGVLDASECPPTFCTPPEMIVGLIAGGDRSLRRSSEGMEDNPHGAHEDLERLSIGPQDSVLGIAAGGTTPYVLGAIEDAHRRGALTGLLTCAQTGSLFHVEHCICVETGPEIVTGSTRMKAGTATKLVLNTITTTLMVRMGKVHENLMVDLNASNDKLRDRAARIIIELCDLPRDGALHLLDRAEGACKVAIVMHRLSISCEAARSRLDEAGGRLREAINA